MFCMLGGAPAIMIARTRVIEKITLSVKRSYIMQKMGRERRGSEVKSSRLDADAPHL